MDKDTNDVKPKKDYRVFRERLLSRPVVNVENSPGTENPVPISEEVFSEFDIAPYSELNLMTTNLWNDDSYTNFIDSLTQAELMVISPVHVQVIMYRLRTNNLPFVKNGAICYPLKAVSQARCLPWHEFHHLPFVVMTWEGKLGNVNEATIDMSKIVRFREFATRRMECPVTGKQGRTPFLG